jgi:hypothetical protein
MKKGKFEGVVRSDESWSGGMIEGMVGGGLSFVIVDWRW